MASASPPPTPTPAAGASAGSLLRRWKLWLLPAVLSGLVALLLSLLYMGGILTPDSSLHRLPIALVDADTGRPLPGERRNLGAQLSSEIVSSSPGEDVQWRRLTRAEAHDQLASGRVYGALVIPADFTDSVRALAEGAADKRPTLTLLTNPGMGSLGSALADQVSGRAAGEASRVLGERLTESSGGGASPSERLLLRDPIAVTTEVGHPIGSRSGLGLSAFYYTLLLVLAGFLAGNIIHNGVDTGLGYADSEIGPWHSRRPTVPVSRAATLLVKMGMTAGLAVLTTALIMVATVGILGMDAPHLPLLALFSYCASLTVGLGVQAINAAFGGIGQLVAMFVFIALALPSSGATVPLEAVPEFYRVLGVFEPMRQLAAGVRAILYFDAQADAGLARAWVMIAIGFAAALVFGFAMARYYDRKGLHRMVPRPE
ncbi:YhgE/Pip domain-containing protein [Streptomyces sp. BBFR102]|uniref:YhgE/Pip domain-containing protein n=1 Tax=Streptomyces sp. BBFR102 TaxID=3448171 RepID=UPI003F530381